MSAISSYECQEPGCTFNINAAGPILTDEDMEMQDYVDEEIRSHEERHRAEKETATATPAPAPLPPEGPADATTEEAWDAFMATAEAERAGRFMKDVDANLVAEALADGLSADSLAYRLDHFRNSRSQYTVAAAARSAAWRKYQSSKK